MARVDDVVYSYIHLDRIEALDLKTRQLIQEAIRYGFQQGESFGKQVKYAEEIEDKLVREVFQETKPKTKNIQMAVRTEKGYKPAELNAYLNKGWNVAHITPMADGRLEYIIETEVQEQQRTQN